MQSGRLYRGLRPYRVSICFAAFHRHAHCPREQTAHADREREREKERWRCVFDVDVQHFCRVGCSSLSRDRFCVERRRKSRDYNRAEQPFSRVNST
ncbi:hypothetical protein PUN28_000676 [Cardiocondyla obscurior]|uniref:Secreted protein n=1 Tax=Cardiocondyla obscurior TaxID=286306 RepID=A0AAW2H0I5_9HYME